MIDAKNKANNNNESGFLRFQIRAFDANLTTVPVIMYIERTEEKKKKKGKTNSFVVINQINYPNFNED